MTGPHRLPRPRMHNAHELSRAPGLGCSLFARRYWGNRVCFLFLGVLRWFTSPRSLHTPYFIQGWIAGVCPAGFPHSETLGSMPACGSPRLIAAYRVLHRPRAPRHPPYALSSLTMKWSCLAQRLCNSIGSIVKEPREPLPDPLFSADAGKGASPSTPGGEYRVRTGDLLVANQALSQLS